ncbi:hypothetical protein PV_032 (endogenous virus) [Gutovirus Vc1]|uniref:Uncharacterized protein n=1 Tax=Vibrio phage Vc1 TaxID=1480731 RepID=X2KT41_9CAUD|nr:hypothetical protein HOQ97_gp32 [Vibrio phage Vc1]AHN84683.1 hypothetical protein PV_032 [Vibrio phage Vc1]
MNEELLVENNARMFAAVTNEARLMLPLLMQEFTIRIKSNEESFKHLRMSVGAERAAKLLGKTLTVKVNWGACGGVTKQSFMWLSIKGAYDNLLLDADDMKAVVTHKGLGHKMFETWKLAAGK